MKTLDRERQGDIKYNASWTTLGQYLEYLEKKGVSPNVASFVGATTVRIHELGEGDVDPTPEQLERMKALVRAAMKEGAMGVGSSMIYAPANYAETPELVAITSRGRQVRRHVHQPHSRRGAEVARGDRRAGPDQPRERSARRNLPLQAIGPEEFRQDRRRHRAGRGGARVGPAHHRRHVHLSRGLDRLRRRLSPCGCRTAGWRRGSSGSRTPPSAPKRSPKCAPTR